MNIFTIALFAKICGWVGVISLILLFIWVFCWILKKTIKSAILEALEEYYSEDDCE